MQRFPLPPRINRPQWRWPKLLAIGAGALLFVLELTALLPEINKLPGSLRVVLVVVTLLVPLVWSSREGALEVKAASGRLRSYDQLYDRLQFEQERADREEMSANQQRTRVATLNLTLTAYIAHPNRFRAVQFDIDTPRLEGEDLVLAIQAVAPAEAVAPRTGELLTVVDPDDGTWLGTLETLKQRSLGGSLLGLVIDGDAVWLGHLRFQAGSRGPLQSRARAIYVSPMAQGEVDE